MANERDLMGSIRVPISLSIAVLKTIRDWMPYYMAVVERQLREDELIPPLKVDNDNEPIWERWFEDPVSYSARRSLDGWPEDEIPCILAVTPGMVDEAIKDGSGRYRGQYHLGIASVASGDAEDSTQLLCEVYGAVARTILLHQLASNLPHMRGITWVNERYDELDPEDERLLGCGQQLFYVELGDLVNENAGPYIDTPPVDPDAVIPPIIIGDYEIIIEKEDLTS